MTHFQECLPRRFRCLLVPIRLCATNGWPSTRSSLLQRL
jgi:hypothetical protein